MIGRCTLGLPRPLGSARSRTIGLITLASLSCRMVPIVVVSEGRKRSGNELRGSIDIIRFATVPGNPINADLHFGWVSKMSFIKVLRRYVEGCEFWESGGRAEPALLDIFHFVIRDEVLGDPANGQGESLGN